MVGAKLVAVLASMIATLVATAAPALAEYQSNTGATKGPFKVVSFVYDGGGVTLECTSAEGPWTILSGGVPATKGKNEQVALEKFSDCKLKTIAIKGVIPIVGLCVVEFEQVAGSQTAISRFVGSCKFEVKALGTCTDTISGSGLKENKLENIGSNEVTTVNDAGITGVPKGESCFGVKETKEAKEKMVATIEGQKWV